MHAQQTQHHDNSPACFLPVEAITGFASQRINFLPNNNFLDWSKLKAFADDKTNVTEKLKTVLEG